MIFQIFPNPESFLYTSKKAKLLWDLKKNVQFVVIKSHYISIQWKSGGLKARYAEIVIQKRSINIIQGIM
jgi:predicted nicotinamide N-methyase